MIARRIGTPLAFLSSLLLAATVAAQDDQSPPPQPKPAQPAQEADLVYVTMKTSMGDFILELNHQKAPITVKNFLSYVDKKHYDGLIFHRVMRDFMIQGGGFTPSLDQRDVDPPIKNEWRNGLKNVRGSIAMARTKVHDSATSQFFINVVDNPFLDEPRDGAAYAVFGKVVKGMDTVDKIRNVSTSRVGMHEALPTTRVIIDRVTRMTDEEVEALRAELESAKNEKPDDNPASAGG